MAFLVIAGVTMLVQTQNASEKVEHIGKRRRAFAGNLLSTQREDFSVLTFITAPMPEADYQTLKTAVSGAAFVECSGDALKATEDYCVDITDSEYIPDGTGFKRIVSLELTEVE
jgi:hypothetical protein